MGQTLGVRLALKGMELIGTTNPKEMIAFIENDRCIADAIQIVTGTRIGRRSAKLVPYGKMAVAMVNTETGAAFRVGIRHVQPEIRHTEEGIRKILHVPDVDLGTSNLKSDTPRRESARSWTSPTLICWPGRGYGYRSSPRTSPGGHSAR
jgi:formylmethanofuran dehydrogenase subunit E